MNQTLEQTEAVPLSPPEPPAGRPDFLREFFDSSNLPLTYDWKIPPEQRVYVVRNLKMEDIHSIGFDMDYTLAIYLKREIEELAFQLSLEKLIANQGYPEQIRELPYDPDSVIRGLVLDRKLGNFLKMDQYHVVTHAVHGKRLLSNAERRELYHNRKIRLGQERYFSVDTLFGLPECSLYQELIEFADANPSVLAPDYARLYDDVRHALDQVHRDNSLKSRICQEPARYVYRDPHLAATLEKFLKGGKKLFIATNSEWWYTDAVMSFLLDGQIPYLPRWTDYFALVVVESAKPFFFVGASPLEAIGEAPHNAAGAPKVFRRGNVAELEAMLATRTENVLFVGDHIYGDVLRSKKNCGWRTVLIVEEMERELSADKAVKHLLAAIARLRSKIERKDFERNLLQMKISLVERMVRSGQSNGDLEAEAAKLERSLAKLDGRIASMHHGLLKLEEALEQRYNPVWGPLFRAGSEISRFGQQVQDHACLYTGRVSNFLAYPFNKFFRSPREIMPHDL